MRNGASVSDCIAKPKVCALSLATNAAASGGVSAGGIGEETFAAATDLSATRSGAGRGTTLAVLDARELGVVEATVSDNKNKRIREGICKIF